MKTNTDSAARFQKAFQKFSEDGYIAFQEEYVQVTEERLAEIIKETSSLPIVVERTNDKKYPYEVSIIYKKTKFLSVGSKKEFKAVGISV